MEIRRFFVNSEDINGDIVTLRGDEFLHMTKVLRYKVGYKANILANDGLERSCTVVEVGSNHAALRIDDVKRVDAKYARVTLFAGLLKNNKLDLVIQKSVELGVDSVVPFLSANSAEKNFQRKRAEKIALEAAKQCGSAYLSSVDDLIDFDGLLERLSEFDLVIAAYEGERHNSIKDLSITAKNVAVIVGPEGGFKEEEIAALRSRGANIVTLGKRILRAETASIVISALLLDKLGELDYEN